MLKVDFKTLIERKAEFCSNITRYTCYSICISGFSEDVIVSLLQLHCKMFRLYFDFISLLFRFDDACLLCISFYFLFLLLLIHQALKNEYLEKETRSLFRSISRILLAINERKQHYCLARCSNISTAGNFLPSKNSKNAPPPVEI